MRKGIILIPREDIMGGAERVMLYFAKQMKRVNIISFTKGNCYSKKRFTKMVKEVFGINLKVDNYICNRIPFKKFEAYTEYYILHKFVKLLDKQDYDFGVVHLNNVYRIKTNKKLVCFIGPGPKLDKKIKILKKIYLLPLQFLTKPKNYKNIVIIPVSKYIEGVLKKRGVKTYKVIYPPVNLSKFKYKGERKIRNRIIYFSRISPDKKQHLIIELAKNMPDYEFVIAGKITNKDYLQKIKNNAPSNVKIYTELSIEKLVSLVKSSTFYIHPAKNDTAPSTVIEAMAAGCIPLVHKSGGPWIDIVEKGKFGFGWTKIDEVKKIVNNLGTHEIKLLRKKVIKKSEEFSNKNFEKKIKELLKNLNLL